MASGERGFGFEKLASALGTYHAEDTLGNWAELTLSDAEDGFYLRTEVFAPAMQGGDLTIRIPIATFATDAGKSYTVPALPRRSSLAQSDDLSLFYDVDGVPLCGNFVASDLSASGDTAGYQGAQEYLSSGGTKTLYLNFVTLVPYKAWELSPEGTVTLPVPNTGYRLLHSERTELSAKNSLSQAEGTLTLTPIDGGLHVNILPTHREAQDTVRFEMPIACFPVQRGLYYTVPALPPKTATALFGVHFKLTHGGKEREMKSHFHPAESQSGSAEEGSWGVDNFCAEASGEATLSLVAEYKAGESDGLITDFDLRFPTVTLSGNITVTPQSGTEYRLDVATAATAQLAFPQQLKNDSILHATLSFKTNAAVPAFSYPATYHFSGDDVTDGVFLPAAQRRYRISFAYDGEKILADVKSYSI